MKTCLLYSATENHPWVIYIYFFILFMIVVVKTQFLLNNLYRIYSIAILICVERKLLKSLLDWWNSFFSIQSLEVAKIPNNLITPCISFLAVHGHLYDGVMQYWRCTINNHYMPTLYKKVFISIDFRYFSATWGG